jgi:hypothetical protein
MDKAGGIERLSGLSGRLAARSAAVVPDSAPRFSWPAALGGDRLAMSPRLASLFGHPAAAALGDEARWRLHLFEAVHFFSLNIAGERELMAGLAVRLYRGPLAETAEYLQHFLAEENAHSAVFARFCLAYGGKVYPDKQLRFERTFAAGEEDFLFFARALVFEELADYFNQAMAADDELCPLSRAINAYHAEDEARHIAFGRRAVAALWERFAPAWPEETRAKALSYLRGYVDATLRGYVNPAVYRDAGLPGDAYALREEALASPERAALSAEAARRPRRLLDDLAAAL